MMACVVFEPCQAVSQLMGLLIQSQGPGSNVFPRFQPGYISAAISITVGHDVSEFDCAEAVKGIISVNSKKKCFILLIIKA
jgi:hypothetical protein